MRLRCVSATAARCVLARPTAPSRSEPARCDGRVVASAPAVGVTAGSYTWVPRRTHTAGRARVATCEPRTAWCAPAASRGRRSPPRFAVHDIAACMGTPLLSSGAAVVQPRANGLLAALSLPRPRRTRRETSGGRCNPRLYQGRSQAVNDRRLQWRRVWTTMCILLILLHTYTCMLTVRLVPRRPCARLCQAADAATSLHSASTPPIAWRRQHMPLTCRTIA
jgi:hypothetical protein